MGAAARAGRRAQLDEDTLTTIGATGVVGLGVLVSAFLVLNVLTGVEAPEVAADVQQAVKKLPGVPNPLPSKAVGECCARHAVGRAVMPVHEMMHDGFQSTLMHRPSPTLSAPALPGS